MRTLLISGFALLVSACGSSNDTHADAACSGGTSCGQPCDEGNSLGVGKFCTKGGGECAKNETYVFCTADFDATAPDAFCTGPCGSDADCGPEAYCDDQGGQSGCVPAACGGTPNG